MLTMTVKQFGELVAPFVQWPVTMRRAAWLEADALVWSVQYPGVLDAGARAFEQLRRQHPEPS